MSVKHPGLPAWVESRSYPAALALFYLAVLILLFRDFVFSDRSIYGSDTLQAGIYFRHFLVDAVRHGHFPLWAPNAYGGMPFVDAFHSDLFYPFTFMKYFLPLGRSRGWELIAHFLLGGMNMYATSREWKIGRPAASVAGLAYMLAPCFVGWVHPGHDGKIFVAAWFPLGFLFLKRIWDRARLWDAATFSLIVGTIILTPHVQMAYFALWGYGAYSACRLIRAVRTEHRLLWRSTVGALGAVVLSLGLSAVQFYPSYFYVKNYSPRAGEGRGFAYAASWSLHPEELISEVVPQFSGVLDAEGNTYWGRNNMKDNTEYGGLVILLLALYAVLHTRFQDRWFFFGLGAVAILYALGAHTPVFGLFYHLVPNVKHLRAPSMIMFLFVFSIVLCAGATIDALMRASEKPGAKHRSRPKVFWISLFLFGSAAVILTIAPSESLEAYVALLYKGILPTRRSLMFAHQSAIVVGFWIATVLTGAVLLWSTKIAQGRFLLAFVAIGCLVGVDDLRMDQRFVKTVDLDQLLGPSQVVSFIKSQPQPTRVLPIPKGFRLNYFALHDIPEMLGYHGNELRSYDRFLGGPQHPRQLNRRAVDLAGVDFLIFRRGVNLTDEPADTTLVKVFDEDSVVVYKNLTALPRVRLVGCWERHDPHDSLYERMFSRDFDYRNCVIVDEELPFASWSDSSAGRARISRYDRERVDIEATTARDALLVLADNNYRDWYAYVDGQPVPTYTVDATFRGVTIPRGEHTVRFEYDSASFRKGVVISSLSGLVIGLLLIVGYRRRGDAEKMPRNGELRERRRLT